jgi:hypothetical protein
LIARRRTVDGERVCGDALCDLLLRGENSLSGNYEKRSVLKAFGGDAERARRAVLILSALGDADIYTL